MQVYIVIYDGELYEVFRDRETAFKCACQYEYPDAELGLFKSWEDLFYEEVDGFVWKLKVIERTLF